VAETEIGSPDPAATLAASQPQGVAAAPPRPAAPATGATAGATAGRAAEPERRAGIWRRWSGWLVIVIPAATSFAVGGFEIGAPSLWRDEAYTKDAIARPFGEIFALLGHQDAVHGAYYLLMHAIAAVFGTSATALRFPSLCAMVIATGFTAAVARRAAALARPPDQAGRGRDAQDGRSRDLQDGRGLDVPALTGLLSGLLFATAPYMTYYAQMARSYAIETMFAVIATYLLLRAWPDGRWRWWLAYAAAVALTGLFNIFGLLILAAHGITLLLSGASGGAGDQARTGDQARVGDQAGAGVRVGVGRRAGRIPLRWLAAAAAAVLVLGPLLGLASRQQEQIGWLTRPTLNAMQRLLIDMAGSMPLIVPFALLALCGLVAAWRADGWRPLNPAAIALPWLVVPPFVLIATSFVKPVYYVRYVEFCLPALAILAGAGLTGLIRLATVAPLSRFRLGRFRLAWLPAVLIVAVLAVLLAGPQQAARQTAARPDNLRLASAIVAAHEQPGDVVFYIPATMHVLGTGYPAPFSRLRDIARKESATASATLTGTEITSPAEIKSRFTDVRRVWVVTGASNYRFPTPFTGADREKMALLAGMHILNRWQAGEVMLTLYGY
jgi:mannosyltransferase